MKRSTTPKKATEKRTLNLPSFPLSIGDLCHSVQLNFVPPPVTEKSSWIHQVSLRSFSATAISASWFSPSSGLSVSGAVINAATSRIRHSSYVVNPPCLRVPNCFRVFPRSNGLNHCYHPFVLSSTNHRGVNPRTHVQITSFWYPCPNFTPPRPVSDASSRDKIQRVYCDGRRCDRSFPRCSFSVKCPQCGLFCEKVVPVELLESAVLEQKAGCTRK